MLGAWGGLADAGDSASGLSGASQLVEKLVAALRARGGRTAKSLAAELAVEKSHINSALYSNRQVFERTGDSPPTWTVRDACRTAGSEPLSTARVVSSYQPVTSRPVAKIDVTQLYDWQREALRAWRLNGRRGIVEAVTGAGKTRLGLAAAAEALGKGEKMAVIVPRIELATQWLAQLQAALPAARLGQMGGGESDTLATCDVLVAVGASASRYELGLGTKPGLLVADECHRYGAEQAQLALEEGFAARLGLSATYERSDGAHETVLEPYFHGVVFRLDYRRAIDDGVVAHFRVALLPVQFDKTERQEYDRLSEELKSAKRTLVTRFGVPAEPYEEFMAAIARMKNGTAREAIAASRYWGAMKRRRALLAETPAKLTVLARIAPAILDADRTIVFTESIDGAELADEALRKLGVRSDVLHSRLATDVRRGALRDFAEGDLKAIVAPTLLDEGVDVPEADFALILAASQQRRQMIQRMGRILRVKKDGRQARFAIAYVANSSEDPVNGAHEAFLAEVLDVADDVRQFATGSTTTEIRTYLAPGVAVTTAAPKDPPGSESASLETPKLTRAERTTMVANRLGIGEDDLLAYRRIRAHALLGTKGLTRARQYRRVGEATGLDVAFVEVWERLEHQMNDRMTPLREEAG
jgi:RNA polymerase primary sigma factor